MKVHRQQNRKYCLKNLVFSLWASDPTEDFFLKSSSRDSIWYLGTSFKSNRKHITKYTLKISFCLSSVRRRLVTWNLGESGLNFSGFPFFHPPLYPPGSPGSSWYMGALLDCPPRWRPSWNRHTALTGTSIAGYQSRCTHCRALCSGDSHDGCVGVWPGCVLV